MTPAKRSSPLRHYLPEPGRWWICHVPRAWPGARGLWTHLGDRTLGAPRPGEVPAIDSEPGSDLVYLPPVEPEQTAARDALARRLTAAGVPVLVQWRPGEGRGREDEVLDPLEVLLVQGVAGLDDLETECRVAVWPLIAGLTDDPANWRRGIDRLAAAGVTALVPCALELAPGERRRLAELTDEAGYQALFHGSRPDERELARLAARAGLEVLPPRPAMPGSPRRVFCRLAATELAQSAELWLRLGRSEAAGEDLQRAARWVERSARDLRALVREGNLEVLPWLDSRSRGVVEDLAAERAPRLRTELAAEYSGGE